jgi:hypothetical protein
MAITVTGETKREGQTKRHTARKNQKKGRELVPLMVQSYLTHGPFNVASMQIVKFNSNGGFRTSITRQCNLPLYNKG